MFGANHRVFREDQENLNNNKSHINGNCTEYYLSIICSVKTNSNNISS